MINVQPGNAQNNRKRPAVFSSKILIYASILILIAASSMLRSMALPYTNIDTDGYVEWYNYIAKRGLEALEDEFSVYTPPYLYLLWVARYFKDSIPAEIAIKLIPIPFDVLNAFIIYKITRTRLERDVSLLAAVGFLCLPTIILNSSFWGQIDSIYTSFLLLSFYMLMEKRPFWAFLFFGISFSVKAQAVFFLPFLGILFLQKKIRWFHFMLIPFVYIISGIPAMMAGRSFTSILLIYFNQAGEFEELAKTAPNLYIFVDPNYYHPALEIGLLVFIVIILSWVWLNWKAEPLQEKSALILAALTCLSLVPFLLPKMHDRYFYPADVFSYAAALLNPRLWFIPFLFQISSGFAYTIFLFNAQPVFVYLAAIINTALVGSITYIQIRSLKKSTQV